MSIAGNSDVADAELIISINTSMMDTKRFMVFTSCERWIVKVVYGCLAQVIQMPLPPHRLHRPVALHSVQGMTRSPPHLLHTPAWQYEHLR